MIKIGVIFGGKSVEHEISVITACQAMNKMDLEKYEIYPIYVDKNLNWYTGNMLKEIEVYQDMSLLKRYAKEVVLYKRKDKVFLGRKNTLFNRVITDLDIIFPIGHGTFLEDGSIQGYVNMLDIPCVGPNHVSATIGQDKVLQKEVYQNNGIEVAKYEWFYDNDYFNNKDEILKKLKKMASSWIIKPATLGSSIGINIAKNEKELENYIFEAINYDEKIIVEEYLDDVKEVNIALLGNKDYQEESLIEEVKGSEKILTYSDKYQNNGKKGMAASKRKIPANISKDEEEKIKLLAKKAFKVLNLSGVSRFDFLITKEKIYLTEVNTIPGSLSFYLFEPINKSYTELIDDLVNLAVKDFRKKKDKLRSFDTNILKNFGGLKGLKGLKK